MKASEIKVGMKVLIMPKHRDETHTYDSQGWDEGMDKFLGTIQTVETVTMSRDGIIFRNSQYYWDPRDLAEVDPIKNVTLKGDKALFDIEELAI